MKWDAIKIFIKLTAFTILLCLHTAHICHTGIADIWPMRKLKVFRIADKNDQRAELGHCTGFYLPDEEIIITAAHCYHGKSFTVVDRNDHAQLDLENTQINYAESEFGLLDILVINQLSSSQIERIMKLPSMVTFPRGDFLITGFPYSRRNQEASIITCKEQENFGHLFRIKLEKTLGVTNLSCRFYDDKDEEVLTHKNVRGLSGGPVLYPDGSLGVAFHFMHEKDTGLQTMKTVETSSIKNLITVNVAQRKYQLSRKLFETIKLPNSTRIALDTYLLNNPATLGQYISTVLSASRVGDKTVFLFQDGHRYEVETQELPISIQRVLVAWLDKSQ